MAHNPVNPLLRPWAQAGLKHLLLSPEKYQEIQELQKKLSHLPQGGVAETQLRNRPASPATQAFKAMDSPPTRPKEYATTQAHTPPSPAQQQRAHNQAATNSQTYANNQAAANNQAHAPQPTSANNQTNTPPQAAKIPINSALTPQAAQSIAKHQATLPWPSYWQELLQRTPKNPRFVWTYQDLARDLGGQPDAKHRDFLRRLVQDMNLPKGSHAFWPLTNWPQNQFTPKMFLQGITTLKPEAVIFMLGNTPDIPDIYAQLNLPPLENISPQVIQGRRYLRTPAVLELLNSSEEYNHLVAFLKSLLSN